MGVTLDGSQRDGTLLVVTDDPNDPAVVRMVDWFHRHGTRLRVLSTPEYQTMRFADRLYVTRDLDSGNERADLWRSRLAPPLHPWVRQ